MKKIFFFLALYLGAYTAYSQSVDMLDSSRFYLNYSNGLSVKLNMANEQDTLCIRDTTMYIILHTTVGPWPGTTNHMKRYHIGQYIVNRKGLVELIVEDHRWVNHAGHSMWNGDTAVSYYSISIELEQYKNPLTDVQIYSLKLLLEMLMDKYHVPDDHVLIHPAVACFYPWDRGSNGVYRRGRKNDAIEFASNDFRAKAGLGPGPMYDPDVMMGRLKADPRLERLLYGKNFTKAEILEYQKRAEYLAARREVAGDTSFITPIQTTEICFVVDDVVVCMPSVVYNTEPTVKEKKRLFFILPRNKNHTKKI